jgi:hypothetical protein
MVKENFGHGLDFGGALSYQPAVTKWLRASGFRLRANQLAA